MGKKYQLRKGLALTRLYDDFIIILQYEDPDRYPGRMGFNDKGLLIWHQLKTPKTVDELIANYMFMYDCKKDYASVLVHTFLERMKEYNLFIEIKD